MIDDGDRLLDLIGVALILFIVLALGVIVLAASNAPYDDDTPDTEWTFDRVNESYVQITHAGGDSIESENLVIDVDGITRNPGWSGPVSPGDSAIIRAERGQPISIYWTGGRGDRAVLEEWRTPPETSQSKTNGTVDAGSG